MKRILLIGAGGYIGSTLCDILLRKGYYVRAVDNFYKGHCDTLLPFVPRKDFHFSFGDICSYEDMCRVTDNIDFVIPLAALVGFPVCQKYQTQAISVNIDGAKNILSVLTNKKSKAKIIYTSTGSVYGEVVNGLCDETTLPNPVSLYGRTKLEAEKLLLNYDNTIIHRYATACGIGYDTTRVNLLINDLVYQAINNRSLTIFQADFKRTFVHVKDICLAILHTIENFDKMLSQYKIYNVGNQKLNYSKRQIAEMIRSLTGCYITYAETGKDLDARNYEVSYDRIYNSGWSPFYDMDYILQELVKATPLLTGWNRYN